jgi:fructosamine-3-kinase
MDVAARIGRLTGSAVRDLRRIGGQHRCGHYRVVLSDGRLAFAKVAAADLGAGLSGIFESEARGLRWLADAAAVPVPEVLGWDTAALAVAWLPARSPDAATAGQFGRDLARLHLAGAARFGAPWPGFIASLPLGNDRADTAEAGSPRIQGGESPDRVPCKVHDGGIHHLAGSGSGGGGDGDGAEGSADARQGDRSGNDRDAFAGDSWPQWYARQRLLPYLRRAFDAGTLTRPDARLIEQVASRAGALAGPAEPPSRIHGDCWSGNLLWSGGRTWLIDPAAHGGHRESDLAMLALFGAPHLDRIMAGYQEAAPLAAGWRARVPLHQLHPLLVHVCLFGTAYRDAALDAARRALAAG